MTTLHSSQSRAHWMRLGTAQILKRFYFCERSIIISCSAWLPLIDSMEFKTLLPRFVWQNAETANSIRERIFELRFPSREMNEEGADRSLIETFDQLKSSPTPAAFFSALSSALLPALETAYREYLKYSDQIADAPTQRFLALALEEKNEQIATIKSWAEIEIDRHPEARVAASSWTNALADRLRTVGGVGTDRFPIEVASQPLPGGRAYEIPDKPARDARYFRTRFYWPDNFDSTFPYGEGQNLQLRSAISHLNEVWAIETGGIILSSFAQILPWEWIRDAARWTFDESRHCRMGSDRLAEWGYQPEELPLGTYIYDSAAGQDPIYRMGMLYFFETKNIRHKPERTRAFHAIGDSTSEHDMDFDWADETMHAAFGRKWLERLLEIRGESPAQYKQIRSRCAELVEATVATVNEVEIDELRSRVEAIIAKAESPQI